MAECGYLEEYPRGIDEFTAELQRHFYDPRVFACTPLGICGGLSTGR
jgi:hypothetical protein